MPGDQGPWHSPAPKGNGKRFFVWIALLAVGAVAVWLLFRAFPGRLGEWDWANLVWLLVLLTVVSAGIVSARRFRWSEIARNVAIWAAIGIVLVLGYTYQDELGVILTRVESEFLPGSAVETAPHTLALTESNDGNFYVYGEVQGARVRFVVDTGASDIVLSPADAAKAGIDLSSLTFVHGFETANGLGDAAPVRLSTIAVGPIRFHDVPASVNRTEMSSSLLGMAFLRRLDGFEIRGRQILLHWH